LFGRGGGRRRRREGAGSLWPLPRALHTCIYF